MALFNYASKEITLKVVYYGPGLCGKTTNLQKLHTTMSSDKKGKLLSLSTDADRTLFFDFMPVHLGKIKDFNIRFQLYTVPGQVRYNATRKLVLKGADAIVFVADSQKAMKDANVESLQNMKENLIANNINPDEIPVVLQYNKRDLKNIMEVSAMNDDMNPTGDETIEASAYEGWGVDETFKLITRRLLQFISKKHNVQIAAPEDEPAPEPVAASNDQINIAVQDKASEMLTESQSTAPSEYGGENISEMLDSGPAGGSIPSDDDWTGKQDDIDTALDSVGSQPAPATPQAQKEDIFDDSDTVTPSPGDSSLLEKMLADEEQQAGSSIESLAAPFSDEAEAEDTDSSVSADVMSELLSEIRETKKMQQEMLAGMKNMSMALKSIISRISPQGQTKQPSKK
jgi:small GTP-binding protein